MPPLPKRAILIVNAASRSGADAFDEAVRRLRDAGVELIDSVAVEDPKRIKDVVRDAVPKAPMVVIGGGDGTLSSTIDFFKDSETVFALLPLGTANSFARALGVPVDLPGAVDAIVTGVRRRIDLGCIDGDYFGNSAAIGLSPMIARTVPSGLKRYIGRVGYALWALKVAAGFRPFRLTIVNGGERRDLVASEVRIANGGYFGGVELVEQADLESGEIVVAVVAAHTRVQLLANWTASALRLPSRDRGTIELRGKKLEIRTDPRMDVTIDGELAACTPVTVWVAKRAVDVAVPSRRD
jgi:YegS/Rv2252/BmrU family lipid kinase